MTGLGASPGRAAGRVRVMRELQVDAKTDKNEILVARELRIPCVVDGRIVARPVMRVTLGADHRVTNGHQGARFLSALDRLLQEPEKL